VTRVARFRPVLIILVSVLIAGSVGFWYFEGWRPLYAFFTSMLIISTLGLLERPRTTAGMVLTMGMIITGVGTLFYLLGQVAETIIENSWGHQRDRRMKRQIAAMRNHSIICGYGRVGRHAAAELASDNKDFVVIDGDPEVVERARADGHTAIDGDATEDHMLKAAGIERAGSLLITTASDAANVFITLTARSYNSRLLIIARASEDSSEPKLMKAGANHVIAPATIGGRRMASLAVRPDAADVVDTLISSQDDQGWLDQTTVGPGSSLAGRKIKEADVYRETGATIIAIRRRDGNTVLNPSSDEYIREGDVLISVGARDEIVQLEDMAGETEHERGHQ